MGVLGLLLSEGACSRFFRMLGGGVVSVVLSAAVEVLRVI